MSKMRNIPLPNQNLKLYRLTMGLKLTDLASQIAGMNRQRLGRMENGQTIPAQELQQIEEALDIPLGTLLRPHHFAPIE